MSLACNKKIEKPIGMSSIYGLLADAFRYPDNKSSKLAGNHSHRPGGAEYLEAFDLALAKDACSLREASYATEAMDVLLEDLIRFYSYFGLKREEKAEMPDHICVELEFMHFLSYLEENVKHTAEEVASLQRVQRDFLVRHLVRLALGIREALGVRHAYYSGQIQTCIDLMGEHLTRLNETVGIADMGEYLPSDLMVGSATSCNDQDKGARSMCQCPDQAKCGAGTS